jgi:hypothetical protein
MTFINEGIVTVKYGARLWASPISDERDPLSIKEGNNVAPVKYDNNPDASVAI